MLWRFIDFVEHFAELGYSLPLISVVSVALPRKRVEDMARILEELYYRNINPNTKGVL